MITKKYKTLIALLICLITYSVSFSQPKKAKIIINSTKEMDTAKVKNQHVYLVDKFIIPKEAIHEFTQKMNFNRNFIKLLPGFIKDDVMANNETNGDLILMTIAVWENQDYLDKAKTEVQTEYKKTNFNPAEFTERLHIKMERQIYHAYQK